MRIYFLLLVFLLSTLLTSCDNELDLIADFRDTPVVYAFLSPSNDMQYFRIERGFVDASTPASELALNPDSLYYQDLVVKVVRVSTGEEYIFSEIDGNDVGIVREDGAFAQSPNTLYTIDTDQMNLVPEEQYELRLERADNAEPVTAITTLIDNPQFVTPNSGSTTLSFLEGQDSRFIWRNLEGALIHDVSLELTISEITGSELSTKTLSWVIARNVKTDRNSTALVSADIDGVNFYQFLRSNLEVDPLTQRQLSNITAVVSSGGEEIFQYITIGQANLGITSSQDIPTYTNLSEGRGLFTTVATNELSGLNLSAVSSDSLRNGRLTGPLNFR